MKKFLLFAAAIFFLASCNDDDTAAPGMLTLSFNNLPDLGSDYVYEGWIMVNGTPETAGRFSVDANGNLSDNNFTFPAETVNSSTAYILTIEPANETGSDLAAPSSVHILAGDFSGNTAQLSIGDARAIGSNFSAVTGSYILATPTTATTSDELSGVWFLDPAAGPGASLTLPTLPSGWKYEGWAVKDGVPYSSGTFSSVTGADDSSMFSGTMPGPPFPGEDFVQGNSAFPTNFQGGTMVISVEPYPDNSPMPFIIKPLVGQVPANAMDHTSYSMSVNQNDIPTGSVTR